MSNGLEELTVPQCSCSKAGESCWNGSCLLSTYEAAADYEPTLAPSSRRRRIVEKKKNRRGGEGAEFEDAGGKAWAKTSMQSIETARLELCRNLSISRYSGSWPFKPLKQLCRCGIPPRKQPFTKANRGGCGGHARCRLVTPTSPFEAPSLLTHVLFPYSSFALGV